jgi:nicotinic acid mononucleotide adenylyltransferase
VNVEVIIEVSIPPEEKNLDSLRMAASRLTNNQKSIKVQTIEKGSSYSKASDQYTLLITAFTMRTTAQYKVVDDIAREFKFWTFDLEGYQDMSISFPKQAGRIVDE